MIGKLEQGHALLYSSGQAAFHAILEQVKPKVIVGTIGYHGIRHCIKTYSELVQGVVVRDLECKQALEVIEDDFKDLEKIDLIHLESPNNPYCIIQEFEKWSRIAEKHNAVISVDATFATPLGHRLGDFPLVRYIHHSCTKFLGGHSDILAGAVICKRKEDFEQMKHDRNHSGGVLGSLESFLLLRSLRTFELRFRKQSANSVIIARWLEEKRISTGLVTHVWHPSLPSHPSFKYAKTFCNDLYPPTFGFSMKTQAMAQKLAQSTYLFVEATSLGGIESLIDWRRRWDPKNPPTLLRISLGIEEVEDLIADLEQAFRVIESL